MANPTGSKTKQQGILTRDDEDPAGRSLEVRSNVDPREMVVPTAFCCRRNRIRLTIEPQPQTIGGGAKTGVAAVFFAPSPNPQGKLIDSSDKEMDANASHDDRAKKTLPRIFSLAHLTVSSG